MENEGLAQEVGMEEVRFFPKEGIGMRSWKSPQPRVWGLFGL